MKHILSLLVLVSIVGCTSTPINTGNPTTNLPPTITKDGLVAYFPFNGNVADESGSKLKVSSQGAGALALDPLGKEKKAYGFEGTDGLIKAELDIDTEKYEQLTITAWVKVSEVNEAERMTIISNDDGDYDRSIGIDNRGEVKGWSAYGGSCGVIGGEKVEANKWTFLAAIYNQKIKTVDFFVNDQKISKNGCEIGPSENKFFHIGNNPGFGQYFKGSVDEVRVYGRALSDLEINTIFRNK